MTECAQCEHEQDPHLVVATTGDPLDGGVIICQVKGCQCFATWGVPQVGTHREDVKVPDRAALEALREQLQTEDPAEHDCELPDVSGWLLTEGDIEATCPECGTRWAPAYGSGSGDSSGWVRVREA